jgi:hypothetical protein
MVRPHVLSQAVVCSKLHYVLCVSFSLKIKIKISAWYSRIYTGEMPRLLLLRAWGNLDPKRGNLRARGGFRRWRWRPVQRQALFDLGPLVGDRGREKEKWRHNYLNFWTVE